MLKKLKKENSLIIDTNIYLRFLLNDIAEQYKVARNIFEKAKVGKAKLFTPQIVIFEIYFGLKKYYGYSKSVIIDSLEGIISHDFLGIQDRHIFIKALKIFKSENISFADSFLKSIQIPGYKLFTFDKKLYKVKN